MKQYYWKTKEGRIINVDDMSKDHLRNSLKMILREFEEGKLVRADKKQNFKLMGDMAQQFNENYPQDEDDDIDDILNDTFRNI